MNIFLLLIVAFLHFSTAFASDSAPQTENEYVRQYEDPRIPKPLIILEMAFMGLFSSTMLWHISDHFFCESLRSIARIMKLSDEFAAVTLLSLANGAPDLFTAFSKPSLSLATFSFNSLFMLCIVLGISILIPEPVKRVSPKKIFDRIPMLRSSLAAFVGLGCACFLGFQQQLVKSIFFPIGMICCFALYFGIVVFCNLHSSKSSSPNASRSPAARAVENSPNATALQGSPQRLIEEIKMLFKEYFTLNWHLPLKLLLLPARAVASVCVIPGKFDLMGKYGTLQQYLTPLAAFFSFILAFKLLGIQFGLLVEFFIWIGATIFSALVRISLFKVDSKGNPEFLLLLSICTFFMSILWMFKCSEWLLEVLVGSSLLSGNRKSTPFMLAIINGMGDLATAISLVQQGKFSIVGVSVFSALAQNLLLVLPICMLKLAISPGRVSSQRPRPLESQSFVAICALVMLLVIFGWIFGLERGKVGRYFGIFLILAYFCCIGASYLPVFRNL